MISKIAPTLLYQLKSRCLLMEELREVINNVGASDGAILNAFTADIDFTVEDLAQNITPS